MKNTFKFIASILLTILVASVISAVVSVIIAFIAGNMQVRTETLITYANTGAATVWGLIVGYKLNSLIKEHRK